MTSRRNSNSVVSVIPRKSLQSPSSSILHGIDYHRPGGALTLGSATGGTGISAHGDGLLVIDNILEVDESTLQFPSIDRLGSLAGVLEADAEVRAPSAGALCVGDCVCGVTDLFIIRQF